MSEACTCGPPRYDGDDGYDRDCPSHGALASELDSVEFYPDEYFVGGVAPGFPQRWVLGFDGSKAAVDGYTALAHRNADGTVHVITVDGFPGPDGEELYASHGYRLHGWDALTLRIWAAQREALAVFDRLEDYWGPWIAALPADGLFDWMGWRPWEMMRAWIVPPDLFLDPPQFPRYWNPPPFPLIPGLDCSLGPNAALVFDTGAPLEDRSRWTLPDYDEDPPPYPPLTNTQSRRVTDVGPMSNDTFRQLLADSLEDADLTIEYHRDPEWP